MEGSWFRPPLVKCWPSAVFTVKPYAARWSLIIFLKIFPLRNTTTNHVILWRTLCISYFVLNCCSTLIFFSRKNKTFTEFFCRRSPEMENIQLKCGDYFHSFSNVRRWWWQIRNHRLSYHNFSLITLNFLISDSLIVCTWRSQIPSRSYRYVFFGNKSYWHQPKYFI